MKEMGTFSAEISKPDDVKDSDIVTVKEVYDIKHDGRFKVRFVARGFEQRQLINYDETFAPTMAYDTLRLFLAIAAKNNCLSVKLMLSQISLMEISRNV